MLPGEFLQAAIVLYGRKRWARELAEALGVDPSTIRRQLRYEQIPVMYEVAILGLLQNKRASEIIDRRQRRQQELDQANPLGRPLPKGYKAWNKPVRPKQTAEQRKRRRKAILERQVDAVVAEVNAQAKGD
jgi:hypothetical protein